MRTRRAAEQGYRIIKRTWDNGETRMESFRLFWLTEETLASGRRRECSQQGFRTKEDARRYFHNKVVPALRAGYASPEEMEADERKRRLAAAEAEPSLKELVDRHLAEAKLHLKPHSLATKTATLNSAVAFLKGEKRKIGEITTDEIRDWVNSSARAKQPKADTRIGRYRALNSVLREAYERGYLAENPCKGIKLPRASKGRMRPLSVEQAGNLLAACKALVPRNGFEASPVFVHAFVAYALYTGARAEEVMHAEWTDLDTERAIVTIQPKSHMDWTTKNNKARVIRTNDCLMKILIEYKADQVARLEDSEARLADLIAWHQAEGEERKKLKRPADLDKYDRPPSMKILIAKAEGVAASLRRQVASPLIFPNPAGQPMTEVPKGYETALKASGLKKLGFVFHSLRETFGTTLAKAGVDLLSLKTLMGHADVETTMRYIAYSPDYAAAHGAKMPDIPVIQLKMDGDEEDRGVAAGSTTQPS
ncbi:MAG: tyrosine-type recombinase/integrase [Sumerlaeia bacterium]